LKNKYWLIAIILLVIILYFKPFTLFSTIPIEENDIIYGKASCYWGTGSWDPIEFNGETYTLNYNVERFENFWTNCVNSYGFCYEWARHPASNVGDPVFNITNGQIKKGLTVNSGNSNLKNYGDYTVSGISGNYCKNYVDNNNGNDLGIHCYTEAMPSAKYYRTGADYHNGQLNITIKRAYMVNYNLDCAHVSFDFKPEMNVSVIKDSTIKLNVLNNYGESLPGKIELYFETVTPVGTSTYDKILDNLIFNLGTTTFDTEEMFGAETNMEIKLIVNPTLKNNPLDFEILNTTYYGSGETPTTFTCQNDFECSLNDKEKLCVENVCVECVLNLHCDTGLVCFDNECITSDGTPQQNETTEPDMTQPEINFCNTDSDCSYTEQCIYGTCKEVIEDTGCHTNNDCGTNYVCINSDCIKQTQPIPTKQDKGFDPTIPVIIGVVGIIGFLLTPKGRLKVKQWLKLFK
jgi:hypothetical protein